MKNRWEKSFKMLDYAIGTLMITILLLATFLLPQGYSAFMDKKDLNQVHVAEREQFTFSSPVEMTVYERVQEMMEALIGKNTLKCTLKLAGKDVTDVELINGIRESLMIAYRYSLIPDITGYDLENNIVYAEYYNLSDTLVQSEETAFWNIRFSDKQTFDFTFRVDAKDYIIYQAELYCAETFDYTMQVMSDDKEVSAFLNGQFMEGCVAYFEAEGYDVLTDFTQGDMILMLGYEKGAYAMYHTSCSNGYIKGEGFHWGFVPMTVALEKGNVINDWGSKGVVAYYRELYDIEIYEERDTQD